MAWVGIAEAGVGHTFVDRSDPGASAQLVGSVASASATDSETIGRWRVVIPAAECPQTLRLSSTSWALASFIVAGFETLAHNGGDDVESLDSISGGSNSGWTPSPFEVAIPDAAGRDVFLDFFLNATGTAAFLIEVEAETPASTSYNCDCDDAPGRRTLKSLRDELMRRLGYGAQVNNPPPGMADLLNSFLVEAQELLFHRYQVLRTERFYSWPLVEGVALYDLPDNVEACTKRLDPRAITWVGVREDGGTWRPLMAGIAPELYSHDLQGNPERYEIRQCIEVWPAPAASEGALVIKGDFGLEAFAADTDKVTIDERAVFLLALANAKAHYRQPDAGNYTQQLEVYIDNLVAGGHQTRRYVPGRDRRGDLIYTAPRPTVPFE